MAAVPPVERRCANCGNLLAGEFCSRCGQRDEPIQQPAWHFVREAATEYFELDGRLWRSLGALFLRPGYLTVEYNAGRRQRYVRPFRLYLTATVLFFFALAVVDPARQVNIDGGPARPDTRVRAGDRVVELDTAIASVEASIAAFESGEIQTWGVPTGDLVVQLRRLAAERAALAALPADSLVEPGSLVPDTVSASGSGVMSALPAWLKGPPVRRLETARSPAELREAKRDLARAVIGRIPTAMFLLLPVFAGILKVLYLSGGGLRRPRRRTRGAFRRARRRQRRPWRRAARSLWGALPRGLRIRRRASLRRLLTARRTRYLSEHLVFALHVHAFAFAVFLVILLLGRLAAAPWAGSASVFLAWTIPVYFVLAQKRVYAQGWTKTVTKAAVLGMFYGVSLVFGGMFALALAASLG
jgi:hypothetical protein